MKLSDWLMIGAIILLIKSDVDLSDLDIHHEEETDRYIRESLEQDDEYRKIQDDRTVQLHITRAMTPCYFKDGMSRTEFETIVKKERKRFRRIKNIKVKGTFILCNVESQTGYTNWEFLLDFNNWGHVTGKYWMLSENDDSLVPVHFADVIADSVRNYLSSKGSALWDYSDYVDANTDLLTDNALNYLKKDSFYSMLFKKSNTICIDFSSADLEHEHIYPVISRLKSMGFKSITSHSIKDIDGKNRYFPLEVEEINISGIQNFYYGDHFSSDSNVTIFYHEKLEIEMPFSASSLKNVYYQDAKDELKALGFTNVQTVEKNDFLTGWLKTEGTVSNIYTNEDGENR